MIRLANNSAAAQLTLSTTRDPNSDLSVSGRIADCSVLFSFDFSFDGRRKLFRIGNCLMIQPSCVTDHPLE